MLRSRHQRRPPTMLTRSPASMSTGRLPTDHCAAEREGAGCRRGTSMEARPCESLTFPPLDSAEFAGVRGQLARAFIAHKADLGLAVAGVSDQAILERVDDIIAVMLGAVARATATRDEDWLS